MANSGQRDPAILLGRLRDNLCNSGALMPAFDCQSIKLDVTLSVLLWQRQRVEPVRLERGRLVPHGRDAVQLSAAGRHRHRFRGRQVSGVLLAS